LKRGRQWITWHKLTDGNEVYGKMKWLDQYRLKKALKMMAHAKADIRQQGQAWFETLLRSGLVFVALELLANASFNRKIRNSIQDWKIQDYLCNWLIRYLDSTFEYGQKQAATALEQLGWMEKRPELAVYYYIYKSDWPACRRLGEKALLPMLEKTLDKNQAQLLTIIQTVVEICQTLNQPELTGEIMGKFILSLKDAASENLVRILEALPGICQQAGKTVAWHSLIKAVIPDLDHWSFAIRQLSAKLLVELYTLDLLQSSDLQEILSQREKIIQPHLDRKSVDSYCRHETGHGWYHVDNFTHSDTGIGVEFPI
jgi:hypothetical protein